MKRLDSHAAVISQGQSHARLCSPSLPPSMWLYCSFATPAAGGAVRLESPTLAPPPTHLAPFCLLFFFFLSHITRLSPILSSFVLGPPSLTSARQCRATAAAAPPSPRPLPKQELPWRLVVASRGVSALKQESVCGGVRVGGWGAYGGCLFPHSSPALFK